VVCERDVWSSSSFERRLRLSLLESLFLARILPPSDLTSRRFRAAVKPRLAAYCSLANYPPPLFIPFLAFYEITAYRRCATR